MVDRSNHSRRRRVQGGGNDSDVEVRGNRKTFVVVDEKTKRVVSVTVSTTVKKPCEEDAEA
jgi:hypothetical protein